MELVKVSNKTKIDISTGSVYETTFYELGGYEVEHRVKTCDGKVVRDRVIVQRDWTRNFLPQIDCDENYYATGRRMFTARTNGFCDLKADEIRVAIAGMQEALEAVEILTAEFCE